MSYRLPKAAPALPIAEPGPWAPWAGTRVPAEAGDGASRAAGQSRGSRAGPQSAHGRDWGRCPTAEHWGGDLAGWTSAVSSSESSAQSPQMNAPPCLWGEDPQPVTSDRACGGQSGLQAGVGKETAKPPGPTPHAPSSYSPLIIFLGCCELNLPVTAGDIFG